MLEFEQIMKAVFGTVSGIFILGGIAALILIFRSRTQRVLFTKVSLSLKISAVLRGISLIVFLIGIIVYVFVLMRGSLFAPDWLKETLMFSALLLMAISVFTMVYVQRIKMLNAIISGVVSLIFLMIGSMFLYNYSVAKTYPDSDESVILHLPFEGEWAGVASGATGLTNHHNRIRSQKYAGDLAKIGENGKLFTEDGTISAHSNTWGATIISPADGVIATAVDRYLDDRSRRALTGNHVAIKMADSVYVMLAHFKLGSLQVREGDSVKVGDPIAQAGNSGNSDFPHLHIHVQTSPEYDIENTQNLPYRFKEGYVKRYLFWRKKENFFLLGNDRVKN